MKDYPVTLVMGFFSLTTSNMGINKIDEQ